MSIVGRRDEHVRYRHLRIRKIIVLVLLRPFLSGSIFLELSVGSLLSILAILLFLVILDYDGRRLPLPWFDWRIFAGQAVRPALRTSRLLMRAL